MCFPVTLADRGVAGLPDFLALVLHPLQFTTMSGALKKFIPLFDRVLVQRLAAETKTKGGVLIPEKAQGKVLEATVVAVGPGIRSETGNLIPTSVKAGDQVLLPEYGGTKITMDNEDMFLFRDTDILGKFES